MNIFDIIDNAQKSIQDILRSIQFKKAVSAREKETAFLTARQKCCGIIKTSMKDYKSIINEQLYYINLGIKQNQAVNVQKETLLNAVLGYVILDDARYAIDSNRTADGLTYAHSLLNYASITMAGKNKHKIRTRITDFKAVHSSFGDQVSEETYEQRKQKAAAIRDILLQRGGDIDQYLHIATPNADEQQTANNAMLASGYPAPAATNPGVGSPFQSSEAAAASAILDTMSGSGNIPNVNLNDLNNSITPPNASDPFKHS